MIGTTLLWPANIEAMRLMIASVRATLVEFECQPGNEILCPELSKLPQSYQLLRAHGNGDELHPPVLASWRAVQVDDNLQAMVARPRNGLLEVGQLAGDVGLSRTRLKGPVADGYTDMVQSNSGRMSVSRWYDWNAITCTHPAAAMAAKSASVILQAAAD